MLVNKNIIKKIMERFHQSGDILNNLKSLLKIEKSREHKLEIA
jgi:hypothetical protein